MQVQEQAARGLLVACGIKSCDDAAVVSRKKVLQRLRNLPGIAAKDNETQKLDEENKLLFDRICDTIKEEGTEAITLVPQEGAVEESEVSSANEETSNVPVDKKKGKKKMSTATATRKNGEVAKGEKGTKGEHKSRRVPTEFLNAWGPREGGEARKVMKFFSEQHTVEEAMAKFDLTEKRVLAHINFWKGKGAPIKMHGKAFVLKYN